jgi:hypothetical protein
MACVRVRVCDYEKLRGEKKGRLKKRTLRIEKVSEERRGEERRGEEKEGDEERKTKNVKNMAYIVSHKQLSLMVGKR